MCSSNQPPPPDPKETSAAQTGTSVGTAIANAWMQNVNQVGPDGTTTFDQSGSYTWKDPYTGKSYTIPKFTQTVELSDQQQATYDQSKAAEFNLAELANQQSAFLKDYMAEPVDLSNEATEARLYELGSSRLDPRFAREEDALRTRLTNQGILEGSDAWNSAMERMSQSKNDAYNQLLLTGRGQAVQERLTERNQPLNEIASLLSGSQVSMPNFMNANVGAIPTTDNAGLIQQGYQNQAQAAAQENQMKQAMLGGLFGLGSMGVYKYSDERLKTDIKKVGKADSGENIYAYRYKAGGPFQLGVMADEIEESDPGAVAQTPSGYKAVNYGRVFGLGA